MVFRFTRNVVAGSAQFRRSFLIDDATIKPMPVQ
jgi:hypothetical protein